MRALEAPNAEALREELRSECLTTGENPDGELASRRLVAALNERLGDIELELELAAPTYAALTRVTLGAGTACALIVWFGDTGRSAFARSAWTLLTSGAGLVGAVAVARVGQLAKSRAARVREGSLRATRSIARSARLE